jgi:hypothetical protein
MRLKHRISRLEVRHRPPAVYPVYAVFAEGGGVHCVCMSDGSRLAGQDAMLAYRQLPRSIPLKAYVGFDPDICHTPLQEVEHSSADGAACAGTRRCGS